MSIFLCFILIFLTGCSEINVESAKDIIPSEIVTPVIKTYDKSLGTTYNLFYERAIESKTLEPSEGMLFGAYILASKNIDYDISTFESSVKKNHDQYVYNYTLGKKFDNNFILKCIARGKTPYIVVSPDFSDRYSLSYLESFSKEVGFFKTDIFIELYPSPSESIYNADEYKLFFENAVKILRKNIKNVSIVFTPNASELSEMEVFYPGHNYVDWIGYKYVGSINPNSEIIYPDFFTKLDYIYKTYEETNPIVISMYTLSHFTTLNHKYYTNEFEEELNTVFSRLNNEYPRVKAINYFDINGTIIGKNYKNDNYSISENATLAKKYGEIVSKNFNSATTNGAISPQLVKTYDIAYKIEDNIYFKEETILDKFAIDSIVINGYNYVLIDDEKYYSDSDLRKMSSEINLQVNEVEKQIIIK